MLKNKGKMCCWVSWMMLELFYLKEKSEFYYRCPAFAMPV